MTETEIKAAVRKILGTIAPEVDFDEIPPDADLRDAAGIDSFDFLNFVIGLEEELGVKVPESDYAQLATLTDIVRYISLPIA
jgi:acyl carrier protein